jgi:hypothetical protein
MFIFLKASVAPALLTLREGYSPIAARGKGGISVLAMRIAARKSRSLHRRFWV